MTPLEKKCIFCERPGELTEEHIWGKWIKQYVRRTQNKHTSARVFVPRPGEPDPPTVKIRAGDTLDASPKIVCKECNSTWMSGIQDRAKPHLVKLFRGEPHIFGAAAQSLVSAWIAMATMTAEHSNVGETLIGVPQKDRDWLMRTQTVPKGWAIWVGSRKSENQAFRWVHSAFPILDTEYMPAIVSDNDRLPNSQTTAFTIGELYFFSFSSLPMIAEGWDWRTAKRARNRLERIFPQKYMAIFWPLPLMTDHDAIWFSNAMVRYGDDLAKRVGWG